jgi:hypothetical protein
MGRRRPPAAARVGKAVHYEEKKSFLGIGRVQFRQTSCVVYALRNFGYRANFLVSSL